MNYEIKDNKIYFNQTKTEIRRLYKINVFDMREITNELTDSVCNSYFKDLEDVKKTVSTNKIKYSNIKTNNCCISEFSIFEDNQENIENYLTYKNFIKELEIKAIPYYSYGWRFGKLGIKKLRDFSISEKPLFLDTKKLSLNSRQRVKKLTNDKAFKTSFKESFKGLTINNREFSEIVTEVLSTCGNKIFTKNEFRIDTEKFLISNGKRYSFFNSRFVALKNPAQITLTETFVEPPKRLGKRDFTVSYKLNNNTYSKTVTLDFYGYDKADFEEINDMFDLYMSM
ncbi:hypothetical protein V8046_004195 [Vibrio parahaemolyticus]|nr:hypothetical protein [Vibrio parahaemolyticus]EIA1625179.1 hypothetical protein [Vibrio parahaemolyticus]EIV8505752.1 hypothetical protein [Vibrio parahaemolyticus]EIV8636633.1 hypothetical protein [Vibrio parahaemolyticus]EIZ1450170.1 hypothetical protein [Vibrio parahaemolyticus]